MNPTHFQGVFFYAPNKNCVTQGRPAVATLTDSQKELTALIDLLLISKKLRILLKVIDLEGGYLSHGFDGCLIGW